MMVEIEDIANLFDWPKKAQRILLDLEDKTGDGNIYWGKQGYLSKRDLFNLLANTEGTTPYSANQLENHTRVYLAKKQST